MALETPVTETVDVYRVEHRRENVGPYNGPESHGLLDRMHWAHTSKTHPSPEFDEVLRMHLPEIDKRHFGFSSLEDFYRWFEGWGFDLRHAGYVLRHFQAGREDVLVGARQCVFYRDRATVLETLDVVTLTPVTNAIQEAAERWAVTGLLDDTAPAPQVAYPRRSERETPSVEEVFL